MRHIPQPMESEAPDGFKAWKRSHRGAVYSRLKERRVKSALKKSLVERQKRLCCYCESRIETDNSHIEHIEPQLGGLSARTLEYSNMAASCIKDPAKDEAVSTDDLGVIRDSLLHCGHARGSNRVVSPYDPRCETLFSYSFSGLVKVKPGLEDPKDIELAKQSIEFLRLNVSTLVSLRKLAMFETVKMLSAGIPSSDILREINGRLPPFISAAATAVRTWSFNAEKSSRADTGEMRQRVSPETPYGSPEPSAGATS